MKNNKICILKILGLTLYINGTATMVMYYKNPFFIGVITMIIGGIIWGIIEGMQN